MPVSFELQVIGCFVFTSEKSNISLLIETFDTKLVSGGISMTIN